MAGIKEIRERISSVEEIMKITNAMYLISSANLQKAKTALDNTAPYFEKLQYTIHHILLHTPEMEHKYFDRHSEKKADERTACYIVVTADKGLAGAYNHNVLKLAEKEITSHKNYCLFVIGQIGKYYFNNRHIRIDGEFPYTAQHPSLYKARDMAEAVIDLFVGRYVDEVYVIYTKMINSMKMEPEILKLFPLERENFKNSDHRQRHSIAEFYPSPEAVMNHLVPDYIKGLLYGVLVESFSCEQSARMTAMSSATDAAKDSIKALSMQYHHARQAAITQEITEIVGGAAAQQNIDM